MSTIQMNLDSTIGPDDLDFADALEANTPPETHEAEPFKATPKYRKLLREARAAIWEASEMNPEAEVFFMDAWAAVDRLLNDAKS